MKMKQFRMLKPERGDRERESRSPTVSKPTVDRRSPTDDSVSVGRSIAVDDRFVDIAFSFSEDHYETMSADTIRPPPRLHRSELSFYVSAVPAKDGDDEDDVPRYESPASVSPSPYVVRNRSLNDLREPRNDSEYRNSASLDDLSRTGDVSPKRFGSERSISSLPARDRFVRKRKDFLRGSFAFSKISPLKIDYSNYFDGAKAARLKSRLSAFYAARKSFDGKKRISRAWHGLKEWFEAERGTAANDSERRRPDSDFDDYEDVDVRVSLDDSFEDDDSNFERAASRRSASRSSFVEIGEPVLVEINCENVDEIDRGRLNDDDVESSLPDRDSADDVRPAVQDRQRQGQNKFDELRTVVKEGSAACKELFALLQQRAETERQYACGVLRVGARARRGARGTGTVALASKGIALDMEARAQLHRQFSIRLVDEVIRSLQRLVSSRDVVRKQVESDVNRTARRLSELRSIEGRMKKLSHAAARFNERIQDVGLAKGSSAAQESELRRKKNKAEEAAIKADVEYYTSCLRAERARVEWETTVEKGSEVLMALEEERWTGTRRALKRYVALASSLGPGSPSEEATSLEDNFDMELANEKRIVRGHSLRLPPAMHLPDFYCQHMTLAMNKERRKRALLRIIELIKTDTERERKSKRALEKLSRAIVATPNFGADDSQQNVSDKLYHMKSLLTYLEGARIQAVGALANLAGRSRVPHPLSPHLQVARDKRGLQRTILTVPPWLQNEYKVVSRNAEEEDGDDECCGGSVSASISARSASPTATLLDCQFSDRGAADGLSVLHYGDLDENVVAVVEDPPKRPPPPQLDIQNSANTTNPS